jgi:HlyD family secretion protein
MLIKKKVVFFCALMSLFGCENSDTFFLAGYTYGEFTYLSFPFTEEVEQLFVSKGDVVTKGQKLMQLAAFPAENALRIAEEKVIAEKALLHNLETGERPAALDIISSQLVRAKSAASLAKRQLDRKEQLYKEKMISAADWERAKEDYVQKSAQVKELLQQLTLKKLPARQAEINNQKSHVESAILQRDKAQWEVRQRILFAPLDGTVYDILYHQGERPPAGKPVISLLPSGSIKIRFYVSEKRLGEIHNGEKVKIYCDGCEKPLRGHVNYISPQAEFSPPVIYSTQRREKLLFMAEAVPVKEDIPLIKAGQPVNVEVIPDE